MLQGVSQLLHVHKDAWTEQTADTARPCVHMETWPLWLEPVSSAGPVPRNEPFSQSVVPPEPQLSKAEAYIRVKHG